MAALLGLLESLSDFGFLHGDGTWHVPADEGERVRAVSLTCARLSIALIPLGFIWFRASNAARWLILIVSGVKVWATVISARDSFESPAAHLDPLGALVSLIGVVAAALLFTPSANRWFAAARQRVGSVFE
ncbi:hypothetical protein [Tsuneonella dongtanensis]|nr:hypothetical protein [Tsuneonella dongtanensis]